GTRLEDIAGEGEREGIGHAARGDRHPGVAGAGVIAGVATVAAGTAREERRVGGHPGAAAVGGNRHADRLRTAARPAVLLPGGDEERAVEKVRGDLRLDRRLGGEKALGGHTLAAGREGRRLRYLHLRDGTVGRWTAAGREVRVAAATGAK